MSSFTPGPWVVSSSFLVCNEEARVIARCDPIGVPSLDIPFSEAQANTRLIAAAPELLAVCEALTFISGHPGATEWRELLRGVRAAIAKLDTARLREERLDSRLSSRGINLRAAALARGMLCEERDRFKAKAESLERELAEAVNTDVVARLERESADLREAIRQVLDDEESRPGAWGPDVTCVGILRDALGEGKD